MDKILLISADFFGYQDSVARAFERQGFQTKVVTYDEPVHPFRGLLKWRHKFSCRKEQLRAKSRQRYALYIREIYREYRPEIVFVFNGTVLEDDTLDYFRNNGSKVIVWMYDSVLRPQREICISHIDHADLFCCFEHSDVEYYAVQGKKAYFLPMAADTDVYRPLNEEKIIDILFVGTIYISPKRIEYLERLAGQYHDKRLAFYGLYRPIYKMPLRWLWFNRRVFHNCNVFPQEVNRLMAQSRIVLNIHNQQTADGANPRLFEASSAGAYQICDRNHYIETLYPNGEIGLYDNFDQMCHLIDHALMHDMTANAQAARKITLINHTFDNRVAQMLQWLNEK